jgi:hypothetical protein
MKRRDGAPRGAGELGASLVEALVSLLLGLLVVCLAVEVVARQRVAVSALARMSDGLAAVRVARQSLGHDGLASDPLRDGWAVSADSVSLRAFRGLGYVCGAGATPRDLVVDVEGIRLPEPAKDSVLVLDPSGRWTPMALDTTAAAACAGPGGENHGEAWRLSEPVPPDAVLARYFERGSYHVVDGALRYRRGLSGRQPITPGVVRTPPSGFDATAGGVRLDLELPGSASPWRVFVSAGAGGAR